MKYAIVAVLASSITIFSLQNHAPFPSGSSSGPWTPPRWRR